MKNIIFVVVCCLLAGCAKNEADQPKFVIGQAYQGGAIFYLDDTGEHGLIASTKDNGTGIWGCNNVLIQGADGIAIGTGAQNTKDIVNGCTTSGIAARICDELVLNEYSDWYLPSKDELELLLEPSVMNKVGGFKTSFYWSSSEGGSGVAWRKKDNSGNQGYSRKDGSNYIRAIRSF